MPSRRSLQKRLGYTFKKPELLELALHAARALVRRREAHLQRVQLGVLRADLLAQLRTEHLPN